MFDSLPTADSPEYQTAERKRCTRCRLDLWGRLVCSRVIFLLMVVSECAYVLWRDASPLKWDGIDIFIMVGIAVMSVVIQRGVRACCPTIGELERDVFALDHEITTKTREMEFARARLAVELDL